MIVYHRSSFFPTLRTAYLIMWPRWHGFKLISNSTWALPYPFGQLHPTLENNYLFFGFWFELVFETAHFLDETLLLFSECFIFLLKLNRLFFKGNNLLFDLCNGLIKIFLDFLSLVFFVFHTFLNSLLNLYNCVFNFNNWSAISLFVVDCIHLFTIHYINCFLQYSFSFFSFSCSSNKNLFLFSKSFKNFAS